MTNLHILKQSLIISYKTNLYNALKEPMATTASILTSMFSLNSVGKVNYLQRNRGQYLSHTDTECFSEDIIQIAMLLY